MGINITLNGGSPVALIGTTLRIRTRKPQNSGLPEGFSNVVLEQVPGATNQARVTFDFAGRTTGIIYARFKSAYAGEGKPPAMTYGIEVAADRLDGKYTINSAANLVPGVTYTCALYWSDGDTGPAWANSIPTGTAVVTSNSVTIVSPSDSVATSISPDAILVPLGTPAGTVVAQLSADVPGGTFSEGSPNSSMFNIAADGTVTTAMAAALVAEWPLVAVHTTNGGSHSEGVAGIVYDLGTGGGDPSAVHPDFTADYTASTWAQVTTKLNEWQANPSGTAPAGKTAMDDRVIRLTGTHSQNVTLQNYTFGTATHPFVRVVGSGSFTESGSTAKTTGKITISNCSGLSIWLMEIVSNSDKTCTLNNTTDCGFGKIWLKGQTSPGPTNSPTRRQGVWLQGLNVRPLLTDIGLDGWDTGMQFNGSTDDAEVCWCAWDWMRCDLFRHDYGTANRLHFHHNLMAARMVAPDTTGHQDYAQFRANTGSVSTILNMIWEDNFMIQRQHYIGAKPSSQGVFFGDGSEPSRNTTVRNTFFYSHNGATKFSAEGTSIGSSITYNAQVIPTGLDPNVSGFGGNTDFNYATTNRAAEDKGAGPNGKVVNGGDSVDPVIYADDLNGTPSLTADWNEFRPKVGGVLHWDHSNPIGPWRLWKEYLVDNLTHEERGWPVAVLARRTMNPNGTALPLSTYTGTFDADGNNA